MIDAWAQVQDVLDLTTEVVDDTVIAVAQGHIEMAQGRLYGDLMGARDTEWLRRAVAYQAAWLPSQPDWAARLEILTDGGGSSATQYAPLALRLAGNARWALGRVSWVRSRGLRVPLPGENDTVDDPEDDEPGWSPWRPVEV